MSLYLVGGRNDPNVTKASTAPKVTVKESSFGNRQYYDSGFTVQQLREGTSAPEVYFGASPHWTHKLSNFNMQHFSRFVYDFFRYFVAPDHFDSKEVTEFEVPQLNSSEYVRHGDIYIRRSGPFNLLNTLNEFASAQTALNDGGLERVLLFCKHGKTVPESMVAALISQIDLFVSLAGKDTSMTGETKEN